VHLDPAKQALIDAFVGFARRIGATVCAEGVEMVEELEILADLDVATGQGYLFARPNRPWPAVDPTASFACAERSRSALRQTQATLGRDDTEATYEAVARALAACRTLGDLDWCLDSMHRLLDVPELSVSRLVDDHGEPALLACAGPRWDEEPPYRLADYPATLRALESGEALQVLASDPTADPSESELLAHNGYGSLLLIPLIAQERPIGTLEAYARSDKPWTRRQIMLARAVAHQLAIVLSQLAAVGEAVSNDDDIELPAA
jgi:transcriptional regulator with GAF, ATPase, and Fis domain